jgi:hypothetical protein
MPYDATVYKVVIASPSDVEKERAIARKVIYKWGVLHSEEKKIILLPIGWETHSYPESGDRAQSILYKQIIKNSDLLIGIFWTRIGTPTGQAESGTVEEIEEHIKTGKPAMLYFSNKDIDPRSINNEQYEKVKALKNKYKGESLYHEFSTDEEFESELYDHLVLKVNDSDYFKPGARIRDSSSLSCLTSVKRLDLSGSKGVNEIAVLGCFTDLVSLKLSETGVSNIEPIRNLHKLEMLDIAGTPVTDISVVKDLNELQVLYIGSTNVRSLEPLRRLIKLRVLYMSNTKKVNSIQAIEGLIRLQSLDVSGTNVSDLTPVQRLLELRVLKAGGAPVADIKPIALLLELEVLDLAGTLVEELQPVASLTKLKTLAIEDTKVSDIKPLGELHALESLNLRGTKVKDIQPVFELKNLQSIVIPQELASDEQMKRQIKMLNDTRSKKKLRPVKVSFR